MQGWRSGWGADGSEWKKRQRTTGIFAAGGSANSLTRLVRALLGFCKGPLGQRLRFDGACFCLDPQACKHLLVASYICESFLLVLTDSALSFRLIFHLRPSCCLVFAHSPIIPTTSFSAPGRGHSHTQRRGDPRLDALDHQFVQPAAKIHLRAGQ